MTDIKALAAWAPSDLDYWTYEQFVEAAQQVISGGNWLLGDLACKVETQYADKTLERFATDVGVDYNSLRQYRQVSSAYGNDERSSNLPWSIHLIFASQPDRVELLRSHSWTAAQARELVAGRRDAISTEALPAPFAPTGQDAEIPELAPGLTGIIDDLIPEDFVDDLDDWSPVEHDRDADPDEAPSVPVIELRSPDTWTDEERELLKRLQAGETVVVNMRAGAHQDLCKWADENGLFVRIDRRTEWGNYFEMPGDGDRETVIRKFAVHCYPQKDSLQAKIGDLRGKALGCWCAPEACHGDVLKQAADNA